MSPATEPRAEGAGRRPEVVVDVEHRAGAYLLVLDNTGCATAYEPRATFEPELVGLGGEVVVSALPIWTSLAMLRPGQRIEVLLDTEAAADGPDGRRPPRFTARVTYSDVDGRRYEAVAEHDLRAWSGLPRLLG